MTPKPLRFVSDSLETMGRALCLAGLSAVTWLTCVCSSLCAEEPRVNSTKRIGVDSKTGVAQAVMTDGVALVHTAQFFPVDQFGQVVGKTATAQTSVLLKHLASVWSRYETKSMTVVKLNFYVKTDAAAVEVRSALAEDWQGNPAVAVSIVQSSLPVTDALVAVDAVAAMDTGTEPPFGFRIGDPAGRHSALLPAGPRIYISGQAEKGTDLAEATQKTLVGLQKTLEYLGSDLKNVVQIKCFLTPMAEVAAAEKAISEFFPGVDPPCVFVEWQSSLPIEIELIAAARTKPVTNTPHEPLEFITPPGMAASPVFCRVVRVNDPRTIFVSGLYSREAGDGAAQVTDVFALLQEILKQSGSDLRHLAKATYYVSDNDASTKLGELRPKYYDPQRPPAASKAQVTSVGMKSRSLTLDMIAVPSK